MLSGGFAQDGVVRRGAEIEQTIEHAALHPSKLLHAGERSHAMKILLGRVHRARTEQVRLQDGGQGFARGKNLKVCAPLEAQSEPLTTEGCYIF